MCLNIAVIDLDQVSKNRLVGWIKESAVCEIRFFDDFNDLTQFEERDRYFVFYSAPIRAIAARLANNGSIAESTSAWREATQSLLSFIRRNPNKVTLIDIATLDTDQNTVALALNPEGYCATQVSRIVGLAQSADPVWLLIGAELIRRDHALAAMASELLTSTLIRSADDDLSDLESLTAKHVAKLREANLLGNELDEAEEPLADLEAPQSRDVDALIRAKEAEVVALSHQLAEGRVEQDALLNELLRVQEDLATRQEEVQQLEARLIQLQQGFKATAAQMRKHDTLGAGQTVEAARLSAELRLVSLTLSQRHAEFSAAQAEILQIKSSRSYRLTAPLRWLRRTVNKPDSHVTR